MSAEALQSVHAAIKLAFEQATRYQPADPVRFVALCLAGDETYTSLPRAPSFNQQEASMALQRALGPAVRKALASPTPIAALGRLLLDPAAPLFSSAAPPAAPPLAAPPPPRAPSPPPEVSPRASQLSSSQLSQSGARAGSPPRAPFPTRPEQIDRTKARGPRAVSRAASRL